MKLYPAAAQGALAGAAGSGLRSRQGGGHERTELAPIYQAPLGWASCPWAHIGQAAPLAPVLVCETAGRESVSGAPAAVGAFHCAAVLSARDRLMEQLATLLFAYAEKFPLVKLIATNDAL